MFLKDYTSISMLYNDCEIADFIVQSLNSHSELYTVGITVKVENGLIILEGEVPSHYKAEAIRHYTELISGSSSVISKITVNIDLY